MCDRFASKGHSESHKDLHCVAIQLHLLCKHFKTRYNVPHRHTGKCIRRFGGNYAYCRYLIDKEVVDIGVYTI